MPYQNKRLNNIETLIRTHSVAYLKTLQRIYGIEMRLIKQLDDIHSDVYGIDSGDVSGEPIYIVGIITGDEFFPSGSFSSGSFTSGLLYTTAPEVEVGDSVSIVASDQLTRRFKIESREALGTTTDVFSRYKLASLGS